jgi:hypothetical protein
MQKAVNRCRRCRRKLKIRADVDNPPDVRAYCPACGRTTLSGYCIPENAFIAWEIENETPEKTVV